MLIFEEEKRIEGSIFRNVILITEYINNNFSLFLIVLLKWQKIEKKKHLRKKKVKNEVIVEGRTISYKNRRGEVTSVEL